MFTKEELLEFKLSNNNIILLIYYMGNNRNKIERWLDRHNHTMELIRTLAAITVLILQIVILFSIFN